MEVVPFGISLTDALCVCVGGGTVAARRVPVLLAGGATVTVVAPLLDPRVRALVEAGRCAHAARPYRVGDCEGAFLVLAATGDPVVDAEVTREALVGSRLICVASDAEQGNCFFMATARRGRMIVALHGGGGAPAVTAALRRRIDAHLPERLEESLDRLAQMRAELRQAVPDPAERASRWRRAVDSGALDLALDLGSEAAFAAVGRILAGGEVT